ncbi:hypothetical protein [Ralstonia phage RSP15]|uniref:hypothetical protein n=1 Tax=Ralstonia phage RSP15 TaxID=1785960 RepID=UPI00074D41F4|nr:hypothetical protein BH754_gp093 [Ralstonia phage RSP15]BAU40051.1 hypothetical protein [Ralstonia phage RSP15]
MMLISIFLTFVIGALFCRMFITFFQHTRNELYLADKLLNASFAFASLSGAVFFLFMFSWLLATKH